MAGLLALVADTLGGELLGAVLGDVAKLAAVVAFGALSAVAAHVTVAIGLVSHHGTQMM